MMTGVSDLMKSERGIWCIAVLLCVTVLAVMRVIDGAAWMDFVKSITYLIVGSKTITTAVETVALKKPQNPPKATATYPAPAADPTPAA